MPIYHAASSQDERDIRAKRERSRRSSHRLHFQSSHSERSRRIQTLPASPILPKSFRRTTARGSRPSPHHHHSPPPSFRPKHRGSLRCVAEEPACTAARATHTFANSRCTNARGKAQPKHTDACIWQLPFATKITRCHPERAFARRIPRVPASPILPKSFRRTTARGSRPSPRHPKIPTHRHPERLAKDPCSFLSLHDHHPKKAVVLPASPPGFIPEARPTSPAAASHSRSTPPSLSPMQFPFQHSATAKRKHPHSISAIICV